MIAETDWALLIDRSSGVTMKPVSPRDAGYLITFPNASCGAGPAATGTASVGKIASAGTASTYASLISNPTA